jgi:hypothetical protein
MVIMYSYRYEYLYNKPEYIVLINPAYGRGGDYGV